MNRYRIEQAPLATLALAQLTLSVWANPTRDTIVLGLVSFGTALVGAVSLTITNRAGEELRAAHPDAADHRVACWQARERNSLYALLLSLVSPAYGALIALRDGRLIGVLLAGLALASYAYRQWVFPQWRQVYLKGKIES